MTHLFCGIWVFFLARRRPVFWKHCIMLTPRLLSWLGESWHHFMALNTSHYASIPPFIGFPLEAAWGKSTKESPLLHTGSPASYCTDLYPILFLRCICAEKHTAPGATFMIFVAIRISWIRVWFIRTPCGREEVSSQGQCGVKYILSTPPLLAKKREKNLTWREQKETWRLGLTMWVLFGK